MSMKDWSTTPANNATVGSISWAEGMPPSQVNDSARQEMADVRYELATQDTIASATTTDLGSKDAGSLTVSGTTTITSFGTVSAGIRKLLTFSGALTLTHNGTSLILPGAANITTVAGDSCIAESLGSGNWKVHSYQRISNVPAVYGTGVATALAVNVGSAGAPVVNGGALGTPSSGVATNLTGTAAGLTAGNASAVAVGGITGLGTGVATALAINVGSAGAPVTFNGALGTPSSGTVTNLTGTASININGTVGATTPTTGAFTTISASGVVTLDSRINLVTTSSINAAGNEGWNSTNGRWTWPKAGATYDYILYNSAGAAVFQVATGTQAIAFPGVGTTASAANAYLDNSASNNLLRSTSSLQYKTDVEPLSSDYADKVLQLSPIWYRSLAPADRKEWSWFGLGAEDVAKIEPRLVNWTYPVIGEEEVEREDGTKGVKPIFGKELVPDGVQYERLSVLLIDVIKRMEKRISALEAANV